LHKSFIMNGLINFTPSGFVQNLSPGTRGDVEFHAGSCGGIAPRRCHGPVRTPSRPKEIPGHVRDRRRRLSERRAIPRTRILDSLQTRGIFRKRFPSWCTSQGYKFLDEVDLDALIAFRDTWTAGPSRKKAGARHRLLLGVHPSRLR
jgi:hypothetical protein